MNQRTPKRVNVAYLSGAAAIEMGSNDQIGDIVSQLKLPASKVAKSIDSSKQVHPRPVVVVVGSGEDFPSEIVPKLTQLVSRGVVRATADLDAVIVDGGTDAGIMRLIGRAVADRGGSSPLLGVAPREKIAVDNQVLSSVTVRLEGNHSDFVLTPGANWGDETKIMFDLAAALSGGRRCLVVVFGGGEVTLREVRQAVKNGWPVILIDGSGGTANELARQWIAKRADGDDPVIADIIADGHLTAFPIAGSADALFRRVQREIAADEILSFAWRRFAALDAGAATEQRRFYFLQSAILALGLAVTALALIQQQFFVDANSSTFGGWWSSIRAGGLSAIILGTPWHRLLSIVIIAIPIVVTVLIAGSNRFKAGNKWVLLRGAAEAMKREIFAYRVRAGAYADEMTREANLSQAIEDITRRLARTEVNSSAIVEYIGTIPPGMYGGSTGDDGLTRLSPDRYIALRLDDQLVYFRRKSVTLERRSRQLNWLLICVGGFGVFLAAVGAELWIALTTAAVTALGSYLSLRRIDTTLITYQQAATDLENIKGWWISLPAEQQAEQATVSNLVEHVERILRSELDGWVQNMQDALVQLRKQQDKDAKADANDNGVTESTTSVEITSVAASTTTKTEKTELTTKENTDDRAAPELGVQPAAQVEKQEAQRSQNGDRISVATDDPVDRGKTGAP